MWGHARYLSCELVVTHHSCSRLPKGRISATGTDPKPRIPATSTDPEHQILASTYVPFTVSVSPPPFRLFWVSGTLGCFSRRRADTAVGPWLAQARRAALARLRSPVQLPVGYACRCTRGPLHWHVGE